MRRGAELRPVQPDPTEDDRQLARDSNLRLPCADARCRLNPPLSQRVVSPEEGDDSVCRLEQQAAHHAVAGD